MRIVPDRIQYVGLGGHEHGGGDVSVWPILSVTPSGCKNSVELHVKPCPLWPSPPFDVSAAIQEAGLPARIRKRFTPELCKKVREVAQERWADPEVQAGRREYEALLRDEARRHRVTADGHNLRQILERMLHNGADPMELHAMVDELVAKSVMES